MACVYKSYLFFFFLNLIQLLEFSGGAKECLELVYFVCFLISSQSGSQSFGDF